MGIRPEHRSLETSQQGICLTGEVVLVESMGPNCLVSAGVGKKELKVISATIPALHERAGVFFSAANVYFFDGQTELRLKPD